MTSPELKGIRITKTPRITFVRPEIAAQWIGTEIPLLPGMRDTGNVYSVDAQTAVNRLAVRNQGAAAEVQRVYEFLFGPLFLTYFDFDKGDCEEIMITTTRSRT